MLNVPEINKSRIGRVWVDGNGITQHWTACSEIWQLAWFIGVSRRNQPN